MKWGKIEAKRLKKCVKNWNECVFDVFSLPRKRIFAPSRLMDDDFL